MGKAARNRAIRRMAVELDATHARKIARAFRRHGRMPLTEGRGLSLPKPFRRWTQSARKDAKRYSDFRHKK